MQISNKKSRKIPIILAILLLVLLIGAGLWYAYKNSKGESDDGLTSTQESGGGITSPRESKEAVDEVTPTPDSSMTPNKPTGTFVSNHRPNLSGSPAPNTITSTCTTTPGAQCTIEFTNGSVVKSLPAKTADANGNVNWDWKLQDIGLSEGTWKITAIASIGSNSAKESDALDLIVTQ